MNKLIEERFNKVAEEYDVQRKYLVPCMTDFYHIATELIEIDHKRPNILDLGAGTGLFTSFIYEKYTEGKFTLIDLSKDMLEISKKRFEGLDNFQFIQGDYIRYEYDDTYDVVVSALSIHHLEDEDKEAMYLKAFSHLKPGGMLVNADQVLGNSDITEAINRKNWLKRIEESPLNEEEKSAAYKRMALDKMATLNQNIKMMKNCGFKSVEVYYKYYNFTVICAIK